MIRLIRFFNTKGVTGSTKIRYILDAVYFDFRGVPARVTSAQNRLISKWSNLIAILVEAMIFTTLFVSFGTSSRHFDHRNSSL